MRISKLVFTFAMGLAASTALVGGLPALSLAQSGLPCPADACCANPLPGSPRAWISPAADFWRSSVGYP